MNILPGEDRGSKGQEDIGGSGKERVPFEKGLESMTVVCQVDGGGGRRGT